MTLPRQSTGPLRMTPSRRPQGETCFASVSDTLGNTSVDPHKMTFGDQYGRHRDHLGRAFSSCHGAGIRRNHFSSAGFRGVADPVLSCRVRRAAQLARVRPDASRRTEANLRQGRHQPRHLRLRDGTGYRCESRPACRARYRRPLRGKLASGAVGIHYHCLNSIADARDLDRSPSSRCSQEAHT